MATYRVQNTGQFGIYFERFIGTEGTITISEWSNMCYYVPDTGKDVPEWAIEGLKKDSDDFAAAAIAFKKGDSVAGLIDKCPVLSQGTPAYSLLHGLSKDELTAWKDKPIHTHHLENFFEAVRADDPKKLNCPPEVAYPTAVAVLNAIPAVEQGKKLSLENAYKKI